MDARGGRGDVAVDPDDQGAGGGIRRIVALVENFLSREGTDRAGDVDLVVVDRDRQVAQRGNEVWLPNDAQRGGVSPLRRGQAGQIGALERADLSRNDILDRTDLGSGLAGRDAKRAKGGRDRTGVTHRARVKRCITQAADDRSRQFADVRRTRRTLLHGAEADAVHGLPVQAVLPGLIDAGRIIIGITVAKFQFERLGPGLIGSDLEDTFTEEVLDAEAALDGQLVAAGTAETAGRGQLQAFVGLGATEFLAVFGAEADRQRHRGQRALDRIDRAADAGGGQLLRVVALQDTDSARIGGHGRCDRAERTEDVDRHATAARTAGCGADCVQRITEVGHIGVAGAHFRATGFTALGRGVPVPAFQAERVLAAQTEHQLVVVGFVSGRTLAQLDCPAAHDQVQVVSHVDHAVAVEVTEVRGQQSAGGPGRIRGVDQGRTLRRRNEGVGQRHEE